MIPETVLIVVILATPILLGDVIIRFARKKNKHINRFFQTEQEKLTEVDP